MDSGICQIKNTVTGDFYIGSAVNIPKRWSQHKRTLTANCHKNAHLQNAWNKHGADNFTFEVVLYCDKEHLLEREQFHIDSEKPSYNICQIAGSNLGRKFSDEAKQRMSQAQMGELSHSFGKHQSEEARLKMSEAKKGKPNGRLGARLSDETKHKISVSQTGRVVSEEHKHKLSEAGKRYWAERKTNNAQMQPRLETA